MTKLLKYLVDHQIANSGTTLKAYTIAVDALGRDDNFDTQIDSYPRVQMGRLRRMLDHFYLREGGESRLYIPQGRYEILWGPNDTAGKAPKPVRSSDWIGESAIGIAASEAEPTSGARSLPRRAALAAALALAIALVVYGIDRFNQSIPTQIGYPAIVVEDLNRPENNFAQANIQSIRSDLAAAMEKFEQIEVYDQNTGMDSDVVYILKTSVPDNTTTAINFHLVNSSTRKVVWSAQLDTSGSASSRDALNRIAIEIAGPYGAVTQNELEKHDKDFDLGYPCLLQFGQYLRYRTSADLKPSLQCLQKSAQAYPSDGYLLAMLAVAQGIAERTGEKFRIAQSAGDIARQSFKADSRSASASFAVAQTAFFKGNCRTGVDWGKRAVDLNPLESRIMGYLGMYMLTCRMPEGEDFAIRALDMDPNADMAIAATLAIRNIQKGDAKKAKAITLKYLASAESYEPGLELAYILSSAALNERQNARRAYARMALRVGSTERATPREVMNRWIANPQLVDELETIFDSVQI